MLPKAKARLPRRWEAHPGELNLESVAEEKIDAVTAEPLHPHKFIEIQSPDNTLRLYYNTSTLIHIAENNGGFMQPPHFREPMEPNLQQKIEAIEEKKFRFEARDVLIPNDEYGENGGLNVMHRHVYFDQIIDEFYTLNLAEVYVCPLCYEHYVKTRYIPVISQERRVNYIDNGATPVIDPLSVLIHMHMGGAAYSENTWDTPLVRVVFRTAIFWKKHMSLHHAIRDVAAQDYRLRDVLCTFYNHFNQLEEERYAARQKEFGNAKKKLALTQQRYWQLNNRYNCLRYNRIVSAVERAEAENGEAIVQKTAFSAGEIISAEANPMMVEEDDSNFINDADSGEDGFIPHYTPDSELDETESNEMDLQRVKPCRAVGKRLRSSSSSLTSSALSSNALASSSDFDNDKDEMESDESGYSRGRTRKGIQNALYAKGLLAKPDFLYESLSAEDRTFFAAATKRMVPPSQLYDPIMHKGTASRNSGSMSIDPCNNEAEEIDWENIGGTLVPYPRQSAEPTQQHSAPLPSFSQSAASVAFLSPKLLLSDGDEDSNIATTSADIQKLFTTSQANTLLPFRRLLIDEDDEG